VMAGEQETGRPLLTPDEAMRLPDDAALIFVAGHPPIYGQKIRYYQDPVFSERATIPPPQEVDRLTHDESPWALRMPRPEEDDAPAETPSATGGASSPDPDPLAGERADDRADLGRFL